jgi:1-acyl-sn-glycerol-3-phosphate acyltransferase
MDAIINRCWRLFATACLFVIFGAGGLISTCSVLPVLCILAPNSATRQRWSRNFVRLSFRTFLALMAGLGVCRFDIDKITREKLSEVSGDLIVANHPTLLDVLILLAHINQANCVVKSSLWRNPFVWCGIRAAKYISNRDTERLMKDCDLALGRHEPLIVFPEATRSVPGLPLRLQRGAANIALRSLATIQVVHIECDPVFLSKKSPWFRVPKRRPCFRIRAGVSLRASDFLRSGETRSIAARRLTRALTGELNKRTVAYGGAGIRAQAASH